MDRACLIASDEEDEDGNLSGSEPTKAVMPEVIYFSENPSYFQPEEEEITDRILPVVHHQTPVVYIPPDSNGELDIKPVIQENSQSSGYGEWERGAGQDAKRDAYVEENSNILKSKKIKVENSNEISESMETINNSSIQAKREKRIVPKVEPVQDGVTVDLPKISTCVKIEPKSTLNEQKVPKISEHNLKTNTTTTTSKIVESQTEANKNNQKASDESTSTTHKRPGSTTTFNAKKIKYDRQATPICDAIMKEYSRRQKLLKMQGSKASPDLSDMPIQEILNKAKSGQDHKKTPDTSNTKEASAKDSTSKKGDPPSSEQKDPLAIVPKEELDVKPNITSINIEKPQTPVVPAPENANATEHQTRKGRGRPRRRYSEDDPPYTPGKTSSSKPVNTIVKPLTVTAQNRLESPKCDAIMKEYSRRQRLLKAQGGKASPDVSDLSIQEILKNANIKEGSKKTTKESNTKAASVKSLSSREEPPSTEQKDTLAVVDQEEIDVKPNITIIDVEETQTPVSTPEITNESEIETPRPRRGRPRVRYTDDDDPPYKPGKPASSKRGNKVVKQSTLSSQNKSESTNSKDETDKLSESNVYVQTQDTCRRRGRSGKCYQDPPYNPKGSIKSNKTVNKGSSTPQSKPVNTKTNRTLRSEPKLLLTPLEQDKRPYLSNSAVSISNYVATNLDIKKQKDTYKNRGNTKEYSDVNDAPGKSSSSMHSNRTARKSFPLSKNKPESTMQKQLKILESQLQSITADKDLDISKTTSCSSNKKNESVESNINVSNPEALSYATRLKDIAEKIADVLSNEPSPNIDHEARILLLTTQELLKLQKENSNSKSVSSVSTDNIQIKQELPDQISSYDNFGLPVMSTSNYVQNNLYNQQGNISGNAASITGTVSVKDKCTFVMDYFTSFKEVFHSQIYQSVIPVMAEILMLCMDDLQECLQRIKNAESVTIAEIRQQEIQLASKAYLKVVIAFGDKFFHHFDFVASNIAKTKTAKAVMVTFIFFLTCSLFIKAPKYKGQTHRVRAVLMLISKIHKYEHPLVWEVLQAPDQVYEEELKTLVQILKYFQKRKFVMIPDYKLFTNWLEKCDQENVQSTELSLMDTLASQLTGNSRSMIQQQSGSTQSPNITPSKLPDIAAQFVEALQSERVCNAKRIEGKLDHILNFLSGNKADGQEPSYAPASEQHAGKSNPVESSSPSLADNSSSQYYSSQQVRNIEPFAHDMTSQEKGTMLTELFEQDHTGLDSLCVSYTKRIKSEPQDSIDGCTQDHFQPFNEAPIEEGSVLQINLPITKEEPRDDYYSEPPTYAPFTTIDSLQPSESMFYSEFEEEQSPILKSELLDIK